jgi:hypothetical protein
VHRTGLIRRDSVWGPQGFTLTQAHPASQTLDHAHNAQGLNYAVYVEHIMKTGATLLPVTAPELSSTEQVHGLRSGATLPHFQYIKTYGLLSSVACTISPFTLTKITPLNLNPPFGASLRANHILLNNAAASQTSIGWHNLMKSYGTIQWDPS